MNTTISAQVTSVAGFARQRPERNTFPEHLSRERVVITPPTACSYVHNGAHTGAFTSAERLSRQAFHAGEVDLSWPNVARICCLSRPAAMSAASKIRAWPGRKMLA